MVVVDRFTKGVHIVPTNDRLTAEGCAMLLYREVYSSVLHGIPDDIVSDRDTLFTSKFFVEFQRLLGTKSTAFHPQTDGQTERANRVIGEVLRKSLNLVQDEWEEVLPGVELSLNTAVKRSLGKDVTPFMLAHCGRQARMPFNLGLPHQHLCLHADGYPAPCAKLRGQDSKVPRAQQLFGQMSGMMSLVRKSLHEAQLRMKQYADQGRRDVEYRVGEEVLLSTKYLRLSMAKGRSDITPKLVPRYIGPFTIKSKVGKAAYRLNLQNTALRVHPVFHVSLLKPYSRTERQTPPPVPYVLDGDVVYDVDHIREHKFVRRGRGKPKLEYLVRWEGYEPEHDSWEPEANLRDAPEPLAKYADDMRSMGKEIRPAAASKSVATGHKGKQPVAPRAAATQAPLVAAGKRRRGKRSGKSKQG